MNDTPERAGAKLTYWYGDGEFHCAVYRYDIYQATYSAKNTDALNTAVSNTFGWS